MNIRSVADRLTALMDQTAAEVLIHHFVPAGFQHTEPGSLEFDLDILGLVARKVETIRQDLGSAGDVLAQQLEEVGYVSQSLGITLSAGVGLGANPIHSFGSSLPDLAMASISPAKASVTTSAFSPSITARDCAPDPPCD